MICIIPMEREFCIKWTNYMKKRLFFEINNVPTAGVHYIEWSGVWKWVDCENSRHLLYMFAITLIHIFPYG